jgi:hypothetical protein
MADARKLGSRRRRRRHASIVKSGTYLALIGSFIDASMPFRRWGGPGRRMPTQGAMLDRRIDGFGQFGPQPWGDGRCDALTGTFQRCID